MPGGRDAGAPSRRGRPANIRHSNRRLTFNRRNFCARRLWPREGMTSRQESRMTLKIAIIVGSLREGSLNRKVARSICGYVATSECSMIEIGIWPLYTRTRHQPARAMGPLPQGGRAADGGAVRQSGYNRGIPLLKNAIDVGSGLTGQSVSTRSGGNRPPRRPAASAVRCDHQIRQAGCSSTCR